MRLALALITFAGAACSDTQSASVCLAGTPSSATVATPAAPALPLSEWFRLHNVAATPKDAGWNDAVIGLAVNGDAFTVQHLKGVDREKLTPEQQGVLDGVVSAIVARTPADTAASLVPALGPRLERAAWADLRCDPLEGTIVPWTGTSITPFCAAPEVRAELERLRDGYESSEADTRMQPMLTTRVRGYAASLLGPQPSLEARYR